MKLGRTLYVSDRKKWRAWLEKNHARADEIWLVYTRKASGKPRIPYSDSVEEALCFGWIDSIQKSIDGERFAQRFSPRRKGSKLSPMNRVRVERLAKAGKMKKAGLEALGNELGRDKKISARKLAPDVEKALKKDPEVWRNFRRFSETYRFIRVGWIEGARSRPDVFRTRLAFLVKKTKRNQMFGMVR